MAFISTTVNSQVLHQKMNIDLFIPTDRKDGPLKQPRAVIYFLHGMSSNEKDFPQFTAANRYAMENHVAMVYVCAPYSFYSNMKNGFQYYTYITEELPRLLNEIFHLPQGRDKTFIAGLSMGGYGALYLGMSRPDIYSACASFSGSVQMREMVEFAKNDPNSRSRLTPVFGENLDMPQENDLYYLARKMSELPEEQQARVFACCGKQDESYYIHDQNTAFNAYMQTLNLKTYKYMEWDGLHDNTFWDRAMLHSIAFFLKNGYDTKQLDLWRCEAE